MSEETSSRASSQQSEESWKNHWNIWKPKFVFFLMVVQIKIITFHSSETQEHSQKFAIFGWPRKKPIKE